MPEQQPSDTLVQYVDGLLAGMSDTEPGAQPRIVAQLLGDPRVLKVRWLTVSVLTQYEEDAKRGIIPPEGTLENDNRLVSARELTKMLKQEGYSHDNIMMALWILSQEELTTTVEF